LVNKGSDSGGSRLHVTKVRLNDEEFAQVLRLLNSFKIEAKSLGDAIRILLLKL
jgi:hypothetical protein